MYTSTVKTYLRGKYAVDIVLNKKEKTVCFWLYQKNYGFKSMMFGVQTKDIDFSNNNELIDMIEANVDDFIPLYQEDISAIEQKEEH